MRYLNTARGVFISRLNRFVAEVRTGGAIHKAHVKNTGRCAELFLLGAPVYLQGHPDFPQRKTAYLLIVVEKGELLINLDSQAPNKVVEEALVNGLILPGLDQPCYTIQREVKRGGSRLDFYVEAGDRQGYIEVKGVTLEQEGIALFPDAPTERGIKHLKELATCAGEGYFAYVIFVIQMKGPTLFCPNDKTHPAFAAALQVAARAGVRIAAYDCLVTPDSMTLRNPIKARIGNEPL